ncbi:MAG: hypothetical protein DMD37_05120 [Gemmatimonadetes bacterium]|nr:MAG: hypothetical protein DMD37_05120 [Gemmatimonadota bacterium]
MSAQPELSPIVGASVAMRRARELVERYAPTALPILLVGATGTGKELLAHHIHRRSGRVGRFVPVNCGALPREMVEGLLFGFERGAFSGAVKLHRGHFERADGGTVFLDELLALPLESQVKLLRALDAGEITRLGGETERCVDARVVAAVQEDVGDRITGGDFREDFYQRLAGVRIELPPLADRPEDIPLLAIHFAACRGQVLEPAALREVRRYEWPGNARELLLAMERAGCLVDDGTVSRAAVLEAIALGGSDPRHHRTPVRCSDEDQRILDACVATRWDLGSAARTLGIHLATVYRRLRAMGVSPREARVQGLLGNANSQVRRANSRANQSMGIGN